MQHIWWDFSAVMDAFFILLSKLVATSHMWLLSAWSVTEELDCFWWYLNLNSHTWLPHWTAQLCGNLQIHTLIWNYFPLCPPTSPVSKMIKILKHMLYKLLYLNLILPTKKKKKKLESSHKDSRWQGAGVEVACSINICERESPSLALGMSDIWMLTRGQRKMVSMATASQLTKSEDDSESRIFWKGITVRSFLLLKLWVACDKNKIALLGSVTKLLPKKNQSTTKDSLDSHGETFPPPQSSIEAASVIKKQSQEIGIFF